MNGRRYWAVLKTRNREMLRERSTLLWNFLFPVMLIAGFALLFQAQSTPYTVGLLSELDGWANPPQLTQLPQVGTLRYDDASQALSALRRQQIHLVLDLDQRLYWVNAYSPQGQVLETLLAYTDEHFRRQLMGQQQLRYIDWAMPGIIAMNMMFACLFGVGYVLVRYRKNGVLKRLRATPLNAFEFLAAHMTSRLLLVLMISTLLLLGSLWILDIVLLGSALDLLVLGILGTLCLSALGLLMAARTRSEELAAGLINFLAWPMIFLSGAWFTIEGAPYWLQTLAQYLPLTHLVEAGRRIMLDGATLGEVSTHLWVLLGMTVLFLSLGSGLFNWSSDHR
jgi:ABC-type multidrug transport system permease subunit